MKRITTALAVLALAISTGVAAQTKLKWAHVYETSEPYHTAAVWAAGEIAKRTNNRYLVEVFPASSLGKETDINQGLTLGTVDIIYTGQLFAGRTHGPLAFGCLDPAAKLPRNVGLLVVESRAERWDRLSPWAVDERPECFDLQP